MKVDRNKIHQKFGGRCAYCGEVLPDSSGKFMHIDHVEPLVRNWGSNDCLFPENDNENNLFPTCIRCNRYKSSLPIESFRYWLKNTPKVLLKNTAFNNAVRYGMIEVKEWDGLFYFEKL